MSKPQLKLPSDTVIVESQIPWTRRHINTPRPKGVTPTKAAPDPVRKGKIVGVSHHRGPVIFYKVEVDDRTYEDVMPAPGWYPGDGDYVWFQMWHRQIMEHGTLELYSCSPLTKR